MIINAIQVLINSNYGGCQILHIILCTIKFLIKAPDHLNNYTLEKELPTVKNIFSFTF